MSLLIDIKKARITAMKEKNTVAKSILTTLLGEAETKAKRDQSEVTDDIVIQLCKKFINSNNETSAVVTDVDVKEALVLENSVLEGFMPNQLTTDELTAIIVALDTKSIGEIMKHLTANYKGLYDGKVASKIARSL